jgi:tetratricopeptide (TPR) repeat protein
MFFGRDELLSELVSLIIHNDQTRLALLGAGGMGKTSTALHVLHHADILSQYKDQRFFVGCDAITSVDSLTELMLWVLQVPLTPKEDVVTVLHRALLVAPPTLLLLDNFETEWDVNSSRAGVIDLLQKIGSAKSVSLIITMRAAVPPGGIMWTQFHILSPLSSPAAKSLFLAINPLPSNGDIGGESSLDFLLAEMNYVPLAIQLLAQVSIGFSPSYMLQRWKKEKTAMLHTHEADPDKLESIEVSISLSLAALDITNNPEAVQLLSTLCQLPDGLYQWEERLTYIGEGFQNVNHLVHILHKTALLFISGDRLKVMSPIRHFITCHHPANTHHIQCLEKYFWSLVHTHATKHVGPDFPHAKEILQADLGNIHSLLLNAVQNHPSSQVVKVVVELSKFLCRTHLSTELLYAVMPWVQEFDEPINQAKVSQILGNNFYMQGKYHKASTTLTDAQRQFNEIGDVHGAALCSRSLGNTLRMQKKYTEASTTLAEAQRQFLEIGNIRGAAECSRSLGDILYMQGEYTEASATLTEAQRQFVEIGDIIGTAQCSRSLGELLGIENKFPEASATLTEARTQFIEIGYVRGAAQSSRSLGNILYMQKKFTEASATLTEARRQFLEIVDVSSAAYCSQSLGKIHYMQGQYHEASVILTESQRHFLDIGDVLGAAQCLQYLGEIFYVQDKYAEASASLIEAHQQFLEIGDVTCATECSNSLAEMKAKGTDIAED